MRNATSRAIAALVSICLIQSARAADVAWGPATTITGDSDVSTAGSLVAAANPGPNGSEPSFPTPVTTTIVNGVAFAAFPLNGNPTTLGSFTIAETPGDLYGRVYGSPLSAPFMNLSPAYQALLSPVITTDSGRTFTVTAASLNPGQEYLFQVWINRSINDDQTMTITSGPALNAIVLDDNNIDGTGGVGQYGIATFTADSANQTFTFEDSRGFPYVNAFQLRAIPEPGAIALLAGAALLAARRRARPAAREG